MAAPKSVALIAYDGDVNEAMYVVPKEEVSSFMERYNDHGHWQVVGTPSLCIYLPMGS